MLGGILPLVIYTVVEAQFGILWGLIAGMVIGVGEIIVEWWKNGRVEGVTWFGNGLILVLGGVSLFTQEGVWFRLQPAILEFAMAALLLGSSAVGKPFLLMMAKKQGALANIPPQMLPTFEGAMNGFNIRIAIFFLAHALLATWAALYWSTAAWIILKGVGFTVSFIVYALIEALFLRRRLRKSKVEGPVVSAPRS